MNEKKNSSSQELTFKEFLKSNASIMFGIDGRLPSTLKTLMFRPGIVTKSIVNGSYDKYTSPTTLYFAINILFFILLPIVNSGSAKFLSFSYESFTISDGFHSNIVNKDLADSELLEIVYQTQFDAHIAYNQPALIFIIIPILSLFLKIIEYRSRKKFLQHLVFSFHFMTYFLIYFMVFASISAISIGIFNLFEGDGVGFLKYLPSISMILFITLIIIYFYKSSRTIDSSGIGKSLLKAIIMTLGFFGIFIGYVNLLFFFTIIYIG